HDPCPAHRTKSMTFGTDSEIARAVFLPSVRQSLHQRNVSIRWPPATHHWSLGLRSTSAARSFASTHCLAERSAVEAVNVTGTYGILGLSHLERVCCMRTVCALQGMKPFVLLPKGPATLSMLCFMVDAPVTLEPPLALSF
ncbi:hypothetical protein, partial [Neomesorhizobium albiziae]|uniref:hypothetical protein n=1 Tax=Neomesorhizobium albiziae TaxID=335020 RepID=UPI0024E1408F